VIGERGLQDGIIEYRHRRATENVDIKLNEIVDFIKNIAKRKRKINFG
jgi:hypothetical protein